MLPVKGCHSMNTSDVTLSNYGARAKPLPPKPPPPFSPLSDPSWTCEISKKEPPLDVRLKVIGTLCNKHKNGMLPFAQGSNYWLSQYLPQQSADFPALLASEACWVHSIPTKSQLNMPQTASKVSSVYSICIGSRFRAPCIVSQWNLQWPVSLIVVAILCLTVHVLAYRQTQMHHISSIQPQIQCTHRTSMLHSSSHCQCQLLSISDQYMSQLLSFSHCQMHNVHWARKIINHILTWPVIQIRCVMLVQKLQQTTTEPTV